MQVHCIASVYFDPFPIPNYALFAPLITPDSVIALMLSSHTGFVIKVLHLLLSLLWTTRQALQLTTYRVWHTSACHAVFACTVKCHLQSSISPVSSTEQHVRLQSALLQSCAAHVRGLLHKLE